MPAAAPGNASDVVRVVTGALAGNSGVTAEVAGRVYGAHLEDPDAGTVDYPLVIVESQGGSLDYQGVVQFSDLHVYAYDRRSSGAALALYDLCRVALQAQLLSASSPSARVVTREVARPVQGWNEQARAWYARGTWRAGTVG